jgi:hypothetical protein
MQNGSPDAGRFKLRLSLQSLLEDSPMEQMKEGGGNNKQTAQYVGRPFQQQPSLLSWQVEIS